MTLPAARLNCSYPNAAAIKAISPNDRQDGDPAFNAGTGVQFHFDADSSAGASSSVLVPDAGSGRWIADTTTAGAVLSTALASTANGEGAALVGSEDAGGFTAKTTTEEQVQELYQHLFSANGGCVSIALSSFREVSATGDVGNAAAIGGVLASDTTPILLGKATTNDWAIQWATGNADPIGVSFMPPADFDDTADATLDLVVSSGSTDAATMGIASSWNGGSEVTDSADDASAKSATEHVITATIAAADIPSGANRATFRITPPTHATNAISLTGARLNYKRKLLTS